MKDEKEEKRHVETCNLRDSPVQVLNGQKVLKKKEGKPVEICFVCRELLPTRMKLNAHIRKHVKCSNCLFPFFSEKQLTMHEKLCRDVSFPCKHCENSYTIVNLERHVENCHQITFEQTYYCYLCLASCSSILKLGQHVFLEHVFNNDALKMIHSEKKLANRVSVCCYLCQSRTIKLTEHLKAHKRCDLCRYQFVSTYLLSKHLKACEQSFLTKSQQNRFIFVLCNVCNKEFSHDLELNEHVQDCHSKQVKNK
jgi:hypothetical protein